MANWTKVAKPTSTSWTPITKAAFPSTNTFIGGSPIGLLLALTTTTITNVPTSIWTNIGKAANTVWTNIAKAT